MTMLLLLTGAPAVSAPVVFTGLLPVSARRRIEALDAQAREAMYIPSLITLPDGTGYWLFGDDTRIMWGAGDTGTAGQVKRRGSLRVKGQSD